MTESSGLRQKPLGKISEHHSLGGHEPQRATPGLGMREDVWVGEA